MAITFLSALCLLTALENTDAIFAINTIRYGEIISEDMVSSSAPVTNSKMGVIGREAARTIYQGQEVTWRNTTEPTLLKRNQLIELRYRRGSLLITTSGRAMSDGRQGDVISVMNLQSRKLITGTVNREGWVEIL